jgi:hypothetical protein
LGVDPGGILPARARTGNSQLQGNMPQSSEDKMITHLFPVFSWHSTKIRNLLRLLLITGLWRLMMPVVMAEVPTSNPPTRASYNINWGDFDAQQNICETVCTKTETTWETSCVDTKVCVRYRTDDPGDPNACTQWDTVKQCTTDPVVTCVQTGKQCHLAPKELPDSDLIQVTIEEHAAGVDPNEVEFRLTTPPGITWYKSICVSDGSGSAWYIENYGKGPGAPVAKHEDHVTLWAAQVKNGQALIFSKAGFLGIHKNSYSLRGLEKLQPGSRVTFNWYRDTP